MSASRWLLTAALFASMPARARPDEDGSCAGVPLAARRIRNVEIGNPFGPLLFAFSGKLDQRLRREVKAELGDTYSGMRVNAAMGLIENKPLAPPSAFGLPLAATVAVLRASNCKVVDGEPSVDLSFYYVPARIPAFSGFSLESRERQMADGAVLSGVAPRRNWLSPWTGYTAASKLAGGFTAGVERPWRGIQSVSVKGNASSQSRGLLVSASGAYETAHPWLKRAELQAGYDFTDEPASGARFQSASGFLEYRAATVPLPKLETSLRYGFSAEGGIRQGNGFVSSPAAPADTRIGSIAAFTGLTRRWSHQSISTSYALQLSETGQARYARHFFDGTHSWWVVPRHYPIEVDSRFSLGQITGAARHAPQSERFFAGNVERNLLRDPSWMIRRQPLLRGLPLNGFGGVSGVRGGGDSFRALNLTAAATVVRKTLIPGDLLDNREFMDRIDVLPEIATGLLAGVYASMDKDFDGDPGIVAARGLIAPAREILKQSRPAWDALAPSLSASRQADYQECTDLAIEILPLDLDDVESGHQRILLIGNRTGAFAETVRCFRNFSAAPGDVLAVAAERLSGFRRDIEAAIAKTPVFERAEKRARPEIAPGKNAIRTLFHEANLISAGPVVAFDAARIGPRAAAGPSWRYSAGAGGRLTILSTLRITVGYAVNMNRQAKEGRGATFFELSILDVFGR